MHLHADQQTILAEEVATYVHVGQLLFFAKLRIIIQVKLTKIGNF
ncbi:unnamed protein product [Cylicostephanus goldi]|uniref:Uncharacterized protein n=1 Tax=Cylicostephanus goldi TaxID=71465 RepID=A0A3P6SW12_CYLGO|nr:unnamed protein product [Cylicostephanus goldi]